MAYLPVQKFGLGNFSKVEVMLLLDWPLLIHATHFFFPQMGPKHNMVEILSFVLLTIVVNIKPVSIIEKFQFSPSLSYKGKSYHLLPSYCSLMNYQVCIAKNSFSNFYLLVWWYKLLAILLLLCILNLEFNCWKNDQMRCIF